MSALSVYHENTIFVISYETWVLITICRILNGIIVTYHYMIIFIYISLRNTLKNHSTALLHLQLGDFLRLLGDPHEAQQQYCITLR